MRAMLGQPIIIENVTGAGGSIGVARVVRAPADGYTMSMGHWTTHVLQRRDLSVAVRSPERHRADRDDRERSAVDRRQEGVAGEGSQGADRLAQGESRQGIDRRPGSGGHRSSRRAVCFRMRSARSFQFIPYRGNGPALHDLVAGQIDLQIEPASNSFAQVKAGAIKAYAITAKNRAPRPATFRPPTRRGFQVSMLRSGMGCGRRRTRRRRSSRD